DVQRVSDFLGAAIALITSHGGVITSHTSVASHGDGGRLPIGDPAHLAPTVEIALAALHAIPCDELDYDDWIRVTCAFKAATGGTADAHDVYVDWSLDYPTNDENDAEAKWESVQDSSLGANWLFTKAAEWGFEPAAHFFEALPDMDGVADEDDNSRESSANRPKAPAPGREGADGPGHGSSPPPSQEEPTH